MSPGLAMAPSARTACYQDRLLKTVTDDLFPIDVPGAPSFSQTGHLLVKVLAGYVTIFRGFGYER
jgi:hypothetical protein